jgi:signal transduction histidine kinase
VELLDPPAVKARDPQGTARQVREACHDMRQPVACVLALTAAALAEPDLPGAARMRLEQIAGQAGWLADMIQHWLGSAAPGDPGKTAASRADVVRVAGEAAAAERLTWPGELKTAWPAGPVQTCVHPVILRRVIANVLGNATRAAGPAGTVALEVRRRAGGSMLSVEDSGPGFGRIGAGHGLGLPAVARSVARHGGWLECGRASLGGARVSLWLP